MGDQHDPAAQPAHERLEPFQAGEVEVVGRLVEQHEVEAAEQQRGQRGPGRLPAGEGGHQARPGRRRGRGRPAPAGSARRGRARRWPASGRGPGRRRRRRPASVPAPSAAAACSMAAVAAAAPVRRATYAATVSPGDPLVLLGQPADERVAGRGRDRRRPAARGRRRGSAAAWSCRRRWRRPRRPRRPGATVRSRDSNRVRCACPPARFLVDEVSRSPGDRSFRASDPPQAASLDRGRGLPWASRRFSKKTRWNASSDRRPTSAYPRRA